MLPNNYEERVYAAVLGKNIGVRLGAPVEAEAWTYDRIRAVYGDQIHGYLRPYDIFGADDDVNGPVYFFKVLEEKADPQLADFAQAWVDYVREGKGFFWWGGIGRSTSHTSYHLIKQGVPLPLSKEALHGLKAEDESIGGQIFVDTLGLALPGNEGRAAELGGRLAAVAHHDDGVYGGRFMAAANAAAFDSCDVIQIIMRALATVPQDSDYAQVVRAVIAFHSAHPARWQDCRQMLEDEWGYNRYSGVCPMIPNAAVCIMALLYSEGDFNLGVEISTLAGWDTDCNAGNVGSILGAFKGLAGIDPCYITPFRDVAILSGVSGDLNICDIPTFSKRIAKRGYELAQVPLPDALKKPDHGLCFDFEMPGSVHGFQVSRGFVLQIANSDAKAYEGKRSLQVLFNRLQKGLESRLFFKTFYTRAEFEDGRYSPVFSPKACPGQVLSLRLYMEQWSGAAPLRLRPYVRTAFDGKDYEGEDFFPANNEWHHLTFTLPQVDGGIIAEVGLHVFSDSANTGEASRDLGRFFLDEVTVSGSASYAIDFAKCHVELGNLTPFAHNHGQWTAEDGAINVTSDESAQSYTGSYEAKDLALSCQVTPLIGSACLLVRGLGTVRHVVAGLTAPNRAGILAGHMGGYTPLMEVDFPWEEGRTYNMTAEAAGDTVTLSIDGMIVATASVPYHHGMYGMALPIAGKASFTQMQVTES